MPLLRVQGRNAGQSLLVYVYLIWHTYLVGLFTHRASHSWPLSRPLRLIWEKVQGPPSVRQAVMNRRFRRPQAGQSKRLAGWSIRKRMRPSAGRKSTPTTRHGELSLRAGVKSDAISKACRQAESDARSNHSQQKRTDNCRTQGPHWPRRCSVGP